MPTEHAHTDPASLGDGAAPAGGPGPAPAPGGEPRPVGDGGAPAERHHPALRRVGIGLGVLLGLLAVVAVGALVFLQTEAGRGWVEGMAVQQITNVFAEDAEVSVERVDGNFLTGARLLGLDVRRDGETVLAVDTITVDYNLTTLLRRTFSASELVVAGPALYVRQRADSTFNVAGLLRPSEDTTGTGFAVVLDAVAVRRGRAEVRWLNAERDSVHTVAGLDAVVREFSSRDGEVAGTIDGVEFVALAPFDAGRARVAGAGSFSGEALTLDRLLVSSRAGTDLSGEARLVFAGDGALPVFEADLQATPLALEDARAFAGLAVYGDPRLRLRADSDGGDLSFSLTAALDEGSLALDGVVSRTTDGPVRYQAEGTLRRFDPSQITRNPALAAEITGDLEVNLLGSSLETVTGPFSVNLRESRVGGRRVDRLDLDGSFSAGRVTFEVAGALPGAALVAEGRARPFDRVPTFQLAGTAERVDLAALLPGSGRTDQFSGDFAVVGRGATLDTFTGSVALDLDRAALDLGERELRLAALALDADIENGRAAFDADVTLADGGGRVAGTGTLDLRSDPLAYVVTDGRAQNLDLAALTGNPSQESDLTGAFTIDGRGLDPAAAAIDLTADLRDSRFGTYAIDAGQLAVELRSGVAGIDADLDFGPGGRLTAEGTARLFADPLAYDLRGTLRNLDLAVVQGVPERYSDLTGVYEVTGAGIDPQTATIDARIEITEPSSYGERLVDAADLVVSLRAGDLAVDGTLATPEGEFEIALTGRPFDESPSFAFQNTCFAGLDLSDFAASAPPTRLSGCFDGRVAGFGDLATASGEGVVTLRPSRVGEAEVEDGRVSFTLSGGALAGTADLTLASPAADEGVEEGGRLVVAFQGRPFDETPTYALRGRTETLDLAGLLDLPPDQPLRLSTTFDVEGRGTDPATLALRGSLAGGPSALGPVTLDTLRTQFALARGVLSVDTLVVDSDVVDAAGGGTIALFNESAGSAFRLAGSVESLAPLAASTEQTLGLESGAFTVAAQAEPGAPLQIVGTAEARQFVYGDYAVTGLDALVNGSWDRTAPDSVGVFDRLDGGLAASFSVLSTPQFRVQEGRAVVGLADGEATVEGSVRVDEGRDLEFYARLDPGVSPPTVLVERGRFSIGETTWALRQPARVTSSEAGLTVRGLLLSTEDGASQIAADGVIDFDGEQNFIVTAEDVAVGGLTDLVGFDALGGEVSATLVLSGPAAAPLIDGTVAIDGLTSQGEPVGALAAEVAYADGRLDLDAVLTHVDGEALTIDGFVPLQFSLAGEAGAREVRDDAGVRFEARADAFPIAWAQPFVEDRFGYTDLGGTLALDLVVTGTQETPRLEGSARLTDGRLGVEATGRVYEPIQAAVAFRNDRIVLEDVRILGEDGQTALAVRGDVRLRELSVGELDLTIVPQDFVAINTRTYDGLVLDAGSAPLRLTGTLERPVLRGSVVLAEGDIYLTDELVPPELEPVELTDVQIRELESRFGRVITARDTAVSRFTQALDYDLTVEIRRNVWLRSEAGIPFDIEFEGDLQAARAAFADESRLYGQIDIVRGTVETFNRQFEVDRGTLTFNGPALGAYVDLEADLDVRLPGTVAGRSSVVITLAATGRFDEDLTIRLGSNPPLEQADIVSLIATGQFASQVVGTNALVGAGSGVLLGRASSVIEGFASETFGVELVQIDYDGNDLVLKIGDYVGNQAFWTAGYVYQTGGSQQGEERLPYIFTLDYFLKQWLTAQTELSGQRGLGGGLSFEQAW